MRMEVHPDGDAVSVRMRHGGGVHRMRYGSPGTPLTRAATRRWRARSSRPC